MRPSSRPWSRLCDDASIVTRSTPRSTSAASVAWRSIGPGVVSVPGGGGHRLPRAVERAQRADAARGAGRVEQVADQAGGGGLAVGAGHADQGEPARRMAEPRGAEHEGGAPAVADHDLRHARRPTRASTTTARRAAAGRRRGRSGGRRPATRAPRGRPSPGRPPGCPRSIRTARDQSRGADTRRSARRSSSSSSRPGERHRLSVPFIRPTPSPRRPVARGSPAAGAVRTHPAQPAQAHPEAPAVQRQRGLAHRAPVTLGTGTGRRRRIGASGTASVTTTTGLVARAPQPRPRPGSGASGVAEDASRPRSIATRREASACCSIVRVTGAAVRPP